MTDRNDSKMSNGEILRGFVTERLAAASQEILTAVDRVVAGYEDEASGFRQEIDRQRKQLEVLRAQVAFNTAGVRCSSRSRGPAEEEEDEDPEEDPEHQEDSSNQTLSRSFPLRCQFKKRKHGRPQISETQNHVDLRIRILEDSQTDVLSNNVLKKCPMLRLKCPRGLREPDFLDLLRSSFPQLSGDDKPFDILTSDKRRRLQPLKVETVTAEEIHRNIGCTGWKSTLYVRLKRRREARAGEEEMNPPQTQDDRAEDFLSAAVAQTCAERPRTSDGVQEVEGGGEDAASIGSTSQLHDMETEVADDADHGTSEPAESKNDGDVEKEEEVNRNDDDWNPDKSDNELKDCESELKEEKARCCDVEAAESSGEVLSCKACGVLHKSEVALVKHAWNHVDEPGGVCGVCGELPESALKDHLESHQNAKDCHICGESFSGVLGLDEHVAAHSGETPYECDVCREAFALKVSLENHQKLHKTDKTNKCYTCHKVFALKEQLKAHRQTHANKKTHLCGVCGKSLSDYRSLSRHKMTHSGERPHSCEVCGRRFKLPGTLRQHKKIHTDRERSYLCDVCCKMFLTSKQLQIHMRTHTNEKPYHCGECGKGFTTKGPLTIHMRVHTGETPYRCSDCGWSFKRKINLDNHVTVHSGAKPFVCGICGKACARKTYLTVHMRTHNGERPYKCTLCDKAFTQSHCLKTHMRGHPVPETAT